MILSKVSENRINAGSAPGYCSADISAEVTDEVIDNHIPLPHAVSIF